MDPNGYSFDRANAKSTHDRLLEADLATGAGRRTETISERPTANSEGETRAGTRPIVPECREIHAAPGGFTVRLARSTFDPAAGWSRFRDRPAQVELIKKAGNTLTRKVNARSVRTRPGSPDA